jgi:hypothetical protein
MASETSRCIYNESFITRLSSYIDGLLLHITLYIGLKESDRNAYNSLRNITLLQSTILEQYNLIKYSFSNHTNSKLSNTINKALDTIYEAITEINQYIKISRDEMYTNPLSKFKVMKDIEDMKRLYCVSHRETVYNGGRKTRKGRKHRKSTRRR